VLRTYFERTIAGVALGLLAATLGAGAEEPHEARARTLFAELTGPLAPLDRVGRLPAILDTADRDRYRRIFARRAATGPAPMR
jgi:hypothetical protein